MRFLLTALLLSLSACSDALLKAHERDANFYAAFTNSAVDLPQAEAKLESLKLLETDASYPMRVALFDNGKFYYQVDKLGDGRGEWEYRDGAVVLVAARPYFDMLLVVSAKDAEGSATVVKFEDRHGLNTVNIGLRDPAQAESRPLKTFRFSEKNL